MGQNYLAIATEGARSMNTNSRTDALRAMVDRVLLKPTKSEAVNLLARRAARVDALLEQLECYADRMGRAPFADQVRVAADALWASTQYLIALEQGRPGLVCSLCGCWITKAEDVVAYWDISDVRKVCHAPRVACGREIMEQSA